MPIKSSRPFVAKLCAGLLVLATTVIANSGRVSGQTLTKEYIRLNGQVVAIENAGFPQIGVNPRTLSFDPQPLAVTSVAQPVTVANSGSTAITLSGMSLGGANAADFSYTTTCGSSLAAGANCTISVQVTPSIVGSETASLAVASSAPSSPSMVSLRATGTGCASNCSLGIDGGGGAAGSFVADTDYTGGSTYSVSSVINTDGVINPAPQAVYQTERYGNFTYTIPGLATGASYTVRLHFAEVYWTQTGSRVFNVSINGNPVLSNFDIVAAVGGANKAIVEEFTATADGNGQIAVQFTTVVDNAKISGIEVLQAVSSGSSYTNSKAITIHHALVPNTDQSNFPLLFSGTYPYLATAANGGGVQNVNGYDLIFASDPAGVNKLNFERRYYSAVTGRVQYWVQIPILSHSSDTTIYLLYGNATVSGDPSNAAGTWSGNYKGVWHMDEASGTELSDSTAYANNATKGSAMDPSPEGGYIGGGQRFVNSGNFAISAQSASTNITSGGITISAIMYPTDSSAYGGIYRRTSDAGNNGGLAQVNLMVNNVGGDITYGVGGASVTWPVGPNYIPVYNQNAWNFVTLTHDFSTNIVLCYLNGTLLPSKTISAAPAEAGNDLIVLGNRAYGVGNNSFPGILDEIRVSSGVLSQDRITTEYSNQINRNNPGVFYSVGP